MTEHFEQGIVLKYYLFIVYYLHLNYFKYAGYIMFYT